MKAKLDCKVLLRTVATTSSPGNRWQESLAHVMTVHSYIRLGKLDAVRLGRRYRIVPEEPKLLIESSRTEKSTRHKTK